MLAMVVPVPLRHPERSEGPGWEVARTSIIEPPLAQVPRYARDDRICCGSISDSFPSEFRLGPTSKQFQRALLADGVGADEDPVLPGRQPAEDLRRYRFVAAEAQARFHSSERVGGEAGALFDREAKLVVPIELIGRERDEAGVHGLVRVELRFDPVAQIAVASRETRCETSAAVDHLIRAEVHRAQGDAGAVISDEHVRAIRRERELEERPRKAGLTVDDGVNAA